MMIDLAIPCLRPDEINWDQLSQYIALIEQASNSKVHLIIVLDGHTIPINGSWLDELNNRFFPHFTLQVLPKNKGKGAAIKAAAAHFQGKYHFFLDADLPYDTSNLLAMLRELQQGADLVIGKRDKSYFKQLNLFRKCLSHSFRWVFVHLWGFSQTDTQAGIKGMSDRGKIVLQQVFLNRYLFDLEFVGRVLAEQLVLTSIPVETRPGIKPTRFRSKIIGKEILDIARVVLQHHWALILSALLSCWLMFGTFSLDTNSQSMKIKVKAFSDFAAHIPFIKSLSEGENYFPMEYPLFSGEANRYHFLFYLLVAGLERIGIPLDWALNLLSSISLFFLCLMLYRWAYLLFRKLAVATLTLLCFWFNATFNWEKYFRQKGLGWESIKQIFSLQDFVAFGPWDGSMVSAFWSLNILSNQRHLALPLGIFFLFLNQVYSRYFLQKKSFSYQALLAWGMVIGLYPLLHQPTLIFYALVLGWFFVVSTRRLDFFWLGICSLIMVVANTYFFLGISPEKISIMFRPGYLATEGHWPWWKYWVWNLGPHFFLIPLGIAFFARHLMIIFPFLLMFTLGNLLQFSREMAANHKFFNLFLMGTLPFSAMMILQGQQIVAKISSWYRRIPLQMLLATLLLMAVSGGIFDFFPIWHDRSILVPGASDALTVAWIKEETAPKAVFVTNRALYHPASLAGRLLYLGHGYFPWSAGYDTHPRAAILQQIYATDDFAGKCQLLRNEKIDYLSYYPQPDHGLPTRNLASIKNQLSPDYENPLDASLIYSQETICRQQNTDKY